MEGSTQTQAHLVHLTAETLSDTQTRLQRNLRKVVHSFPPFTVQDDMLKCVERGVAFSVPAHNKPHGIKKELLCVQSTK